MAEPCTSDTRPLSAVVCGRIRVLARLTTGLTKRNLLRPNLPLGIKMFIGVRVVLRLGYFHGCPWWGEIDRGHLQPGIYRPCSLSSCTIRSRCWPSSAKNDSVKVIVQRDLGLTLQKPTVSVVGDLQKGSDTSTGTVLMPVLLTDVPIPLIDEELGLSFKQSRVGKP